MRKDTEKEARVDEVRNRKGQFVTYGTSVSAPLETWLKGALKLASGDVFWVQVADDNRSFTVYLDPPQSNDGQ